MNHDDFEREPLPGLPAMPPEGEQILWQGKPEWKVVARRVMHVDLVAIYVAGLLTWRLAGAKSAGASYSDALSALVPLALTSIVAISLLLAIAWGIGRTTIYTLTSRRVVLRFGIALPVTFNLPFKSIASANLRRTSSNTGDIALQLEPGTRLAYLILWPHVRAWRLRSPEPTLRSIADADAVAAKLADALNTHSKVAPQRTRTAQTAVRVPAEARGQPVLVAAE